METYTRMDVYTSGQRGSNRTGTGEKKRRQFNTIDRIDLSFIALLHSKEKGLKRHPTPRESETAGAEGRYR